MEAKVILREAAPDDVEAIVAVQTASPGVALWSAADYSSLLAEDKSVSLVAEDSVGERVAGFLVGRFVAEELEVLNLAVAPDYRRRGIARRLLGEALAQARACGAGQCWLEVRVSNQPALEFYRALGFAESHRRWRYYRDPVEDAVVCVRRVAPAGPLP